LVGSILIYKNPFLTDIARFNDISEIGGHLNIGNNILSVISVPNNVLNCLQVISTNNDVLSDISGLNNISEEDEFSVRVSLFS